MIRKLLSALPRSNFANAVGSFRWDSEPFLNAIPHKMVIKMVLLRWISHEFESGVLDGNSDSALHIVFRQFHELGDSPNLSFKVLLQILKKNPQNVVILHVVIPRRIMVPNLPPMGDPRKNCVSKIVHCHIARFQAHVSWKEIVERDENVNRVAGNVNVLASLGDLTVLAVGLE